jgi:hypothetical protein
MKTLTYPEGSQFTRRAGRAGITQDLSASVGVDGSSSHGGCPEKELPKHKKLVQFLRNRGFMLGRAGDLIFLHDLVMNIADTHGVIRFVEPVRDKRWKAGGISIAQEYICDCGQITAIL